MHRAVRRKRGHTTSELVAAGIAEGVADGSIPGDVDAQAAAERLTALIELGA